MNNIPAEIYLYCNKNPVDILVIYSSCLLSVILSVFHFDSLINNTNHIYNKLSNIPEVLLDIFFEKEEEEDNYLTVSMEYEQSFIITQDTTDVIKQNEANPIQEQDIVKPNENNIKQYQSDATQEQDKINVKQDQDTIDIVKQDQDTIDLVKQGQEGLLRDMELSDKVNNLCLPEQIEKSHVKEELLPSESFNLKDWNKLENRSDSYYKSGKNDRWASLFKF